MEKGVRKKNGRREKKYIVTLPQCQGTYFRALLFLIAFIKLVNRGDGRPQLSIYYESKIIISWQFFVHLYFLPSIPFYSTTPNLKCFKKYVREREMRKRLIGSAPSVQHSVVLLISRRKKKKDEA